MDIKLLFIAILAFFLVCCGRGTPTTEETGEAAAADMTEDIAQAMPDATESIFENEFVRVMKVSLEPGEKQPVHAGAPRAIYSLTDYTINWMENGEDLGAKIWKAGDAHWHDALPHAVENTGSTTAEYLVVARKGATLPACDLADLAEDVNKAAPDYATVLLENDQVRVTRVGLPAGASLPEHAGINRVIYSLSDYKIDYSSDKEGATSETFRAGEAHWHEACRHQLTNSGAMEAQFLIFAFKK